MVALVPRAKANCAVSRSRPIPLPRTSESVPRLVKQLAVAVEAAVAVKADWRGGSGRIDRYRRRARRGPLHEIAVIARVVSGPRTALPPARPARRSAHDLDGDDASVST